MPIVQKTTCRIQSCERGFTLIEAVITIAIIGIIASVAWSYYKSEIKANRRREAVAMLTTISQVMQQCKTDVGNYAPCNVTWVAPNAGNSKDTEFSCARYTYDTTNTGTSYSINPAGCHYKVTIKIPSPNTYQLTATKNSNDDQECTSLTLDNLGRKNYAGTAPDYHRCWGN